MITLSPRYLVFYIVAIITTCTVYSLFNSQQHVRPPPTPYRKGPPPLRPLGSRKWKDVTTHYPVDPESMVHLPSGQGAYIPPIQHEFQPESALQNLEREERLKAVVKSFVHSWEGYKSHAWLQDEVTPLTADFKNGFGGWGATLVDSLDTLWIMGMHSEFEMAVRALRQIDFTTNPLFKVNVFETTIRFLGGLLSAYDVSEGKYPILLAKAIEIGDMLYVAFDTPNRMPITQWDWHHAASGGQQDAPNRVLEAEYGSFSLEFTRLSQLSGDPKYYDAMNRIMMIFEAQQNVTKLPGMWPISLNARAQQFMLDRSFTLGALADSLYEYLPKQHLMLGGCSPSYRSMYETFITVAKEQLFYRVLNPANEKLLLSGSGKMAGMGGIPSLHLKNEGAHLTCFVGGMVGLAAKAFDSPADLKIARQLVDGCIWAYESMPTGIMPESFLAAPCKDDADCVWSEQRWYEAIRAAHMDGDARTMSLNDHAQKVISKKGLAPGFTDIDDPRYLLRPEAIESVFILYRITGDRTLQDKAWKMFQAIERHARTPIAYASIEDVTASSVETTKQLDSMESFWTGETLKYFYLIFSEPHVVSLDEFVFNTEAHPFRRPQAGLVH